MVLDPIYYISIDAVWPKDVPFGASTQKIYVWGLFKKTSSFLGGNRDF
jgi:hypothetical protein